ncbi:MAG: DNA polymerase III subunit delta' [Actinomycetota bacterium]
MQPVLAAVPGQDGAVAFLSAAAARPHHAYLLAGPEGSGRSLIARAFAASLLCRSGGCGACRDCRLVLADHHPNEFIVEPEGRDIHVDTIRDEVWLPASRTAPEPGRKVFMIREADRLSPAAADTLLKVLEEPPPETVFLLLSARAHELPPTIWSRCHAVTVAALSEDFVIEQLGADGVDAERAELAARLAGGNLGRARRMVTPEGLAFRETAVQALEAAEHGAQGALDAASLIMDAAAAFKKGMKATLDLELAPFQDERGRTEEAYRGAVKRLETRHQRRERRAERDQIDRILMAMSGLVRDRIAAAAGADRSSMMHTDIRPGPASLQGAVATVAQIERARADLAEDFNRNVRLVVERAMLGLVAYATR